MNQRLASISILLLALYTPVLNAAELPLARDLERDVREAERQGIPLLVFAAWIPETFEPSAKLRKVAVFLDGRSPRVTYAILALGSGLLFWLLRLNGNIVLQKLIDERTIVSFRAVAFELAAARIGAIECTAFYDDLLNPALLDISDELGIFNRCLGSLLRPKVVEYRQQYHRDNDPQDQIFCHIIQSSNLNKYSRKTYYIIRDLAST